MLFEAEGILGFVVFALWIWAIVDCITSDKERVRNLPKGIWLVIVILLFDLGAILWVLLGRPNQKRWHPGAGPSTIAMPRSAPRSTRGVAPRPAPRGEVSDRRSAELDRQLEQWEAERRGGEPDSD
jgi:hypothetical protein